MSVDWADHWIDRTLRVMEKEDVLMSEELKKLKQSQKYVDNRAKPDCPCEACKMKQAIAEGTEYMEPQDR